MPEEGLLSQIKRVIVGQPIPSHLAHHERLSRFTGLAVLSSDPLSSVAYATEEILRVLILVGVGALTIATPVAFIIAAIQHLVLASAAGGQFSGLTLHSEADWERVRETLRRTVRALYAPS